MKARVLIFSAALTACVAPLTASQLATPSNPATGPGPTDNPAKPQTFLFEMVLRAAVESGGQKLAQQALVLVPQLALTTNEQPLVRGIKLDGWGFFFDVQAPDIQSTMMVWDMVQETARSRRAASSPNQPVNDRVMSTAGPAADPMVNAPAEFDPTSAYTTYVREALVNALLDSSGVLPLGPDDHLTIAASGIDQPNTNPLYRSWNSRKLVLTIRGADLQEFRVGKITREQAKSRIDEGRF